MEQRKNLTMVHEWAMTGFNGNGTVNTCKSIAFKLYYTSNHKDIG
jgi:hypothetical protein